MRILITGAAGFIGSHTADLLCKQRHQVLAVDNFSTGRTENLKQFKGHVNVADVTDKKLLEKIFYDFLPDAVLHLAAQAAITTSMEDPGFDAKINTIGTINVLEMCRKYKTGKIVFSSTSAVYSTKPAILPMNESWEKSPDSPYGMSKLAAEYYVRSMFPNHVIFRYGNVYGPRQHPIGENQVIARALKHFMAGDEFYVVGSGNQKRDFIYVGDVARANVMALVSPDLKGTYNLCTGYSHSVNRVLFEIEKYFGVNGYPWDHKGKEDPRGDVHLNNWKLRRDFGLVTTSLAAGITNTCDWWKEQK